MSGKQFLLVVAVLVLLVAGGAGVAWWKRSTYEVVDARVGQRLVPGLKVDDVAAIVIADAQGTVTLVRGDRGWSVQERGGFPAELDPIRDLLVKLAELKVLQVDALSDAIRPRMRLAAPGSGAKPQDTGVAVTLKGRDGEAIAQLVLGKQAFRSAEVAGMGGGIASGRYVWTAADPQRVNVVNEPFSNVASKAPQWLARELARVERIQSVTAIGADGKERWSVSKDTEAGDWRLAGTGKLDPGKAQDAASALYGLQLADAAVDVSDAEAGLDQPTKIRAQTFDGWAYELEIGKPASADRYYAKSAVIGNLPDARPSAPDEKAADKERADQAFAERKAALGATLERERAVAGRTVLVARAAVEPLLRDRGALLAIDKPKEKDTAKAPKK